MTSLDQSDIEGLSQIIVTLNLIKQTLKFESLNKFDFFLQMNARIIEGRLSFIDLKFDEIKKKDGKKTCHFRPIHSSLKENHRIDLTLRTPGCQVLSTKFFSDKTRVAISFSNGMIAIYNTSNHCTEMVLPLGSAIVDLIKV